MFKIQIQYNRTEAFQEIATYEDYDKALDRFQSMLIFFKIPHYLDYTPEVIKEYTYKHLEQNITLTLTHQENEN
jgi:hypothetical protein